MLQDLILDRKMRAHEDGKACSCSIASIVELQVFSLWQCLHIIAVYYSFYI